MILGIQLQCLKVKDKNCLVLENLDKIYDQICLAFF